MRKWVIVAVAAAALSQTQVAQAQDPAASAATGARVGADIGAVVVGLPAAIVGGVIGGTLGSGPLPAERARIEERVIVERPPTIIERPVVERPIAERRPATRDRNCATGPSGVTVCEELRR